MLLAFDIGNTNIVIGCFDEERLVQVWRLKTDPDRTVDEYTGILFSLFEKKFESLDVFSRCIISSVVPPVTPDIIAVVGGLGLKPLVVGPGVKTGLKINIHEPATVGSDRVVNAVAARIMYGAPAIVIDFGTATSFDYVSEEGDYEGGVIVPGVKISLDSLVSHTAKLPRIELSWPERVVGKSTVLAMQSGAVIGYSCLVDGLIAAIQEEVGGVENVVATGGLGELFSKHSKVGITAYAPDLTLHGLRIIADLNAK